MKTPDEIKKGLKCHIVNHSCRGCPYKRDTPIIHINDLYDDALAYIQQLEAGIDHAEKVTRECAKSITENMDKLQSRLIQVEMERDAMSYDMHQLQGALCAYCENLYRPAGSKKVSCKVFGDGYGAEDNSPLICGKFKWRGLCEENTKEEN